MSKINHERPYLKYIDNIRRETQRPITDGKHKLSGVENYDISIARKMDSLPLTQEERGATSEFFSSLLTYIFTQAELVASLHPNKHHLTASAQERLTTAKDKMIAASAMMFAVEMAAKASGMESNISKWVNLLGKITHKHDAYLWEFLKEKIFTKSIEALVIAAELESNRY